jgi:ABC-2 type transport system permease protein
VTARTDRVGPTPLAATRTVVRLGVRSVFGRRRGVLLLVLPVVMLGMAVLVRSLLGQDVRGAESTLDGLGLAVVTPLVALLATSGVLAPEIDDGSIAYLLAKPVSRHTLALAKMLVSVGCVLACAALPVLLAGLVLLPGDPRVAVAFGVGALAGGAAYCALFALLSVLTRHAVVVGLVYLLVWEGLVGGLVDGVRRVSITRWSGAVADAVSGAPPVVGALGATYALTATLVVVVGGTWLTGRALRSFNLTGDE